jgi:hypothetical protein
LRTLPVPSTALLDGGPVFETRLGGEVALRVRGTLAEIDVGGRTVAVTAVVVSAFALAEGGHGYSESTQRVAALA